MVRNYSLSDFKDFQNADTLVNLGNSVSTIGNVFYRINFILACVGVAINSFHILVLSRKSMLTSVINVFLIGIAFSDCVNLSILVHKIWLSVAEIDECALPKTPFEKIFLYILLVLKDDFRRLSTCFGILMAFLRYVIIRNVLNPKYDYLSKPFIAWMTILIAFIISTILSFYYLARLKLISTGVWVAPEICGYNSNYSVPIYNFTQNDLFFSSRDIYRAVISFDGVLKMVPVLVLPLVAICLVRELRAAEKARRKISTIRASSQNSNATYNTSKMVIIMTITCIIAEGPLGVDLIIEGLVANSAPLRNMVVDIGEILSVFVTLNATTHFFVCLAVSRQYRSAMKELISFRKPKKPLTITPKISNASIVTIRQVNVRLES